VTRLLRLGVAAILGLSAVPVRADEPVQGSADARVTILVFSAFACPYCAEGHKQLESLRARYGDRLQIVFKHFPLGFDRDGYLPHEAALAAAEQDKFWPMHDGLFAHQANLGPDVVARLAREIGLDEARFSAALSTRRFRAQVDRDIAEARALGVRVAPTFFLDGIKLEGLQSLETMNEVVSFRMKDLGDAKPPAAPAASAPSPRPSPR
jgi:protein-disulfide isomerase